jgi:hypothetical protein
MSLSQQKLGFHYYPDTDHYTESDLNTWLPVLESAGASWLTLLARDDGLIPQHFIEAITGVGIKPIIQIQAPIGSLRLAKVYPTLRTYAEWGIEHVIIYDRPNLRSSWPGSNWAHQALVDRFIDYMLPILEAQCEMGLVPTFPALEPGGDYWDTAFLERSFKVLSEKCPESILSDLHMALYMWTYGHPTDWGQGGKTAWPDARPYATPLGTQDQRGFRIYEWYQEIAERILGHKVPILVAAGGAGPSEYFDSTEAIQLGNNEVARYLATHDLPEECLNFCFYPLAAAEEHSDFQSAWYRRTVSPGPKHKKTPKVPAEKTCFSIDHYVLLGLSNQTNAIEFWHALSPLALSIRPTIGFSLEEAKRARRVTLVGDLSAFSTDVKEELRNSGAHIEHIQELDTDEIYQAASNLAAEPMAIGEDHE